MIKKNKYKIKRLFIFNLKPRKIKQSKFIKLSNNKKNALIYLILNESIQDREYIKDFIKNHHDLIINIERSDFKNWFNQNKKKYKKYILLNNNMHVRHEYRWVRDQSYLSFLIS